MWDLYTYWNSASMATALNAVAMVVGGSNFLGLMQSMAFIGLLASATVGLVKFSAKEPVQYLGIIALVYGTLFLPKVTVTIQDVRTGAVQPVANVPLGVAFIATQTSHIGKYLTDFFETSFGGTDAEKFSRSGMSWSATAMEKLTSIPVNDDTLASSMGEFVRACINPEVQEDPSKLTQLVNSPDILEYLAGPTATFLNPGRLVRMPTLVVMGAPAVYTAQAPYIMQPCDAAGSAIKLWIESKVNASQTWIGRQLYPDASAATAFALVGANLPFAEAALIGSSRTITAQIKQAIAQQLVTDSTAMQSMLRGDAAAAQLAAGVATAKAAANSNYKTLALIGTEALPKMRNIVEAVAISVFPIVILVIIVAGERAFSVFAAYALTFVWVQLWAPLYALINGLFNPMAASRIGQAMGGVSQTIMNTESMTSAALREQTMAGALVMAVPAIAYAIVKGGMAGATSALGSMTRGSEKAAETQGSAAGLGNYSFGNASWGNASMNSMGANKWDSNIGHSDGRYTQSHGNVGQRHDMGSGQSAVDGSGIRSDLGNLAGTFAAQGSRAAGSMARKQWGEAASALSGLTNTLSAGLQAYRNRGKSSGNSESVGNTYGANWTSEQAAAAGRVLSTLNEVSSGHGFQTSQESNLQRGVSGGLDFGARGTVSTGDGGGGGGGGGGGKNGGQVGGGASVGADSSLNFKNSEQAQQFAQALQKLANSEQFRKDLKSAFGATKGQTGSEVATAGNTRGSGEQASLDRGLGAIDTAASAAIRGAAYEQVSQSGRAVGAQVSQDLGHRMIEIAGGGNAAVGAGIVQNMLRKGDNAGLANLMLQAAGGELGGTSGGGGGLGSLAVGDGGKPADPMGVGGTPDGGVVGRVDNKVDQAERDIGGGVNGAAGGAVLKQDARNKSTFADPGDKAVFKPLTSEQQTVEGMKAGEKAVRAVTADQIDGSSRTAVNPEHEQRIRERATGTPSDFPN